MKKILYSAGLLIIAISGITCSDDFLSNNNENWYTLSDTLYLNNNQENIDTTIQLPVIIDSDYSIFMQPKWLSFNSMHGRVTGGGVDLSFNIVKEYVTGGYGTQYAIIVLDIDNIGLISFYVAYSNFGSPVMQCSASSLNFKTYASQTFTIGNASEGILNWEITGKPDWLLISVSSGSLSYNNSTIITASLDLNNITPGQDLTGALQINSNSTSGGFTITVHVSDMAIIPSEVRQIKGIVTDSEYNHEYGIMAICTVTPNSLIIFNTTTNKSNTIPLSYSPNCIGLSEDGHKAMIGYSVPVVSYIDIDNLKITRDYTIDCVSYDIVLGGNGWCYITPAVEQWTAPGTLI